MTSSGATPTLKADHAALVEELTRLLGDGHVSTDPDELELCSVDFSEQRLATAAVVARPGSVDDVRGIIAIAEKHGAPLVPRGASMSYTLGPIPQRPGSIVVDMRRMNRILDINLDDLTVTVETGVTWAELRAALAGCAYEIPFHGPFSGSRATVGGGLGNWAVGWGKGDITTYLLGVEVALADGRLLQTGALATDPQHPALTCYGPDLTRLFINDAGSLGIKTKACFRLERKAGGSAYAAWGFAEEDQALALMSEIGRLGVATDCFVFGPYHHRVFYSRPRPPAHEAKALLRAIARQSSGRLNAARNLFDLLRGGKLGFLARWPWSVQTIVDGANQRAADAAMGALRSAARRLGGKPIPPSLVIAMRAMPFVPIEELIVGIDGECSFPSNCTVSLSQGMALKRALDAFFAERADFMHAHGLTATRLYLTTANAFGVEPIIYWRDRMNPLRYSVLGEDRRRRFGHQPENATAREAALALRREMVTNIFAPFRPTHVQVGKYYPYRASRHNPDCWSVLEGIKNAVDPKRLMNPGALGLD